MKRPQTWSLFPNFTSSGFFDANWGGEVRKFWHLPVWICRFLLQELKTISLWCSVPLRYRVSNCERASKHIYCVLNKDDVIILLARRRHNPTDAAIDLLFYSAMSEQEETHWAADARDSVTETVNSLINFTRIWCFLSDWSVKVLHVSALNTWWKVSVITTVCSKFKWKLDSGGRFTDVCWFQGREVTGLSAGFTETKKLWWVCVVQQLQLFLWDRSRVEDKNITDRGFLTVSVCFRSWWRNLIFRPRCSRFPASRLPSVADRRSETSSLGAASPLTLIVSFSGRWLRLAPKLTVERSVDSCDHVSEASELLSPTGSCRAFLYSSFLVAG